MSDGVDGEEGGVEMGGVMEWMSNRVDGVYLSRCESIIYCFESCNYLIGSIFEIDGLRFWESGAIAFGVVGL